MTGVPQIVPTQHVNVYRAPGVRLTGADTLVKALWLMGALVMFTEPINVYGESCRLMLKVTGIALSLPEMFFTIADTVLGVGLYWQE